VTQLLLDTTFLIDVERNQTPLNGALTEADDFAIAAITLAELYVGVGLASNRHREARLTFVHAIADTIPVIAYDKQIVQAHAELLLHTRRVGTPRGAHDLIIAATAKATGRQVVSADASAFRDLPGVTVIGH
jgi:tRNA(fMet)-specific endonuclease VapC